MYQLVITNVINTLEVLNFGLKCGVSVALLVLERKDAISIELSSSVVFLKDDMICFSDAV